MKIENILQKIPFEKDLILNVYYYGSHLWKYATKYSDIDLIIVIKNRLKYDNFKQCMHVDNYDMQIYDDDTFQKALDDNLFLPILTQLYKECILKESKKFKCILKTANLKKSLIDEINRDILFANKLVTKNMVDKANNTLKHSIRMAHIGLKIINKEPIDVSSESFETYEQGVIIINKLLTEINRK
jgi:predicted nucleotidyltransferase